MSELSVEARRSAMVDMVASAGFATIAALSDALAVSEMTVRRDVSALEAQGGVQSFHGGVAIRFSRTSSMSHSAHEDLKSKLALARSIETLIPATGAIAVDSGGLLETLSGSFTRHAGLSIATHSLSLMNRLASCDQIRLVALGGIFDDNSRSFRGSTTVTAIDEMSFDTVFLSALGVSERGVFCDEDADLAIKRAMISSSKSVILVVPARVFAAPAGMRICGLSQLTHIIVDGELDDHARELLHQVRLEQSSPTLVVTDDTPQLSSV